MATRDHWEGVYSRRAVTDVSWYTPRLARSLELMDAVGVGPDAALIDVGAGASTLVDDLLERGFRDLTVLDLADAALAVSRDRLGERASAVTWRADDVLTADFAPGRYDVWHDRAVFHFLVDPADRDRYVDQVLRAVRPGGHVLLATFALDGPDRCSGLPVARYDADGIHAAFGPRFAKLGSLAEVHNTPAGATQAFTWCYCLRLE
ncbi:MAG: SAM-dependent methyltransferase [Deltaproteobacteria bacterium HGW-Deltaproteobacteria-14]|jgi:2-polyprenyl-3-methyl-5-hydroxy-6-metoxy-1,4-benzoquinol methylase|nr:MAG: SAM-dependent methyltransferase [Deltaproteobacteria bacterium HGW-Deltaproteobacteria-14]